MVLGPLGCLLRAGPVLTTNHMAPHTCLGRHDLVGVPIRLLSRVLDATGSSSGSSG